MAIETLDRSEVFQFLRPDQVKTISDVAEAVSYRAGETVYSKGARRTTSTSFSRARSPSACRGNGE